MVYWKESGYFDSAAHEKWLLHTWSLSAEWQFYILYPIGLLALKKLTSIKNLHYFLILGTVLAFAFSVYASYRWPNPSYYVLPTRAWEMMIGGVAYLLPISFGKRSKATFES
ncbi:acyltransferase, partial [Vibrio parahaemolyticus]